MHIILVDDNDEFRTVTSEFLSRSGHVVRTATTGNDALQALRKTPADLLITDIIMPTDDGLALVKRVRKEFPGVAVIGISGTSSNSMLYLKIAGQLGASVTLLKPFSADELLIAIEQVELSRTKKRDR
jgi:CheY-like chemotaxis protein